MSEAKLVDKIKRYILCSVPVFFFFYFRKSCHLWDNVEKYYVTRQGTNGNMTHAHCMPDTYGYKHTLRICNTYCFSTAPMVESSWNVMAHCDAWEGKWRWNCLMECVASTFHTTSEHDVSSITTADAHTSAAGSRLNWHPCRFNHLALQLDIYSLAHNLCKMWIFFMNQEG